VLQETQVCVTCKVGIDGVITVGAAFCTRRCGKTCCHNGDPKTSKVQRNSMCRSLRKQGAGMWCRTGPATRCWLGRAATGLPSLPRSAQLSRVTAYGIFGTRPPHLQGIFAGSKALCLSSAECCSLAPCCSCGRLNHCEAVLAMEGLVYE